jgi:hypothetical protein
VDEAYAGDVVANVKPFDAIALELRRWWLDDA